MEIYEEALKVMDERDISHYYSDLQLRVTKTSTELVRRFLGKYQFQIFKSKRSDESGAKWYDIPFAYTPFFDEADKKSRAQCCPVKEGNTSSVVTMSNIKKYIEAFCEENGCRIYESYNGRGMGNHCCLGIVCEDTTKTALKLQDFLHDDVGVVISKDVKTALLNTQTDEMGLRKILYFPKIRIDN